MKPAPIPDNEPQRLKALGRYRILDTAPEAQFDDLVLIAAQILDVPIALVSLIDVDRQWFKARYGLDAPQTPRDVSFCGHAVASGEPLIVRDATADPRFADNPLVVGDPRVVFYAGAPLTTPDGYTLGTLCAIDHTPRTPTGDQLEALAALSRSAVRLLEARREKFAAEQRRRMLDASPALFAVLDLHGYLLDVDPSWGELLGWSVERMKQERKGGFLHPEDGPRFRRLTLQSVKTGEPLSASVRVLTRDNTYRTVLVSGAPDVPEGKIYICGIDVTDRSRLREMQNEFVSVVSHELRTPLTSIYGSLALIEGGVVGGINPEAMELVQVARGNCDRLVRLVNDILDMERMRSGETQLDLTRASVDDVLRRALAEVAGFAESYGVTLRSEELPETVGIVDADRIIQAVTNLLSNAIKFSKRGDDVVLFATKRESRLRVCVADTGPGLSEADQERVFERFVQADSGDDRPHGGTGLGLAITRAIVQEHGGTLGVESVLGQGSTFWFELPILD